MSPTSPDPTNSAARPTGPPNAHRPRRRAPWLIAAAVVLVAAGMSVALSDPFSSGGTSQPGLASNGDPTSLYTVARQNLFSQIQLPATLGYAGSYSVVNQAQGTVTAVPAVGQVASQGQVLYQVSGAPVVLLYGSTPAYRTLSPGLIGADVAELNADLVALGYATSTEHPVGAQLRSPTGPRWAWRSFRPPWARPRTAPCRWDKPCSSAHRGRG